ncbi:MAG: hypothetical protein ACLR8P_02245 [Clostridium fessum]
MGVGSAALATAISQFVSAILCMVHLMRVKEDYRLELRRIRFDRHMLRQIIQNGVPSGFQNSVIATQPTCLYSPTSMHSVKWPWQAAELILR